MFLGVYPYDNLNENKLNAVLRWSRQMILILSFDNYSLAFLPGIAKVRERGKRKFLSGGGILSAS